MCKDVFKRTNARDWTELDLNTGCPVANNHNRIQRDRTRVRRKARRQLKAKLKELY